MYNPERHSVSLNTGHKYIIPKIYINGKFVPINIFIYIDSIIYESSKVGIGVADYMIVD